MVANFSIGSLDPLALRNPPCPCGTRRRALAPWPGRPWSGRRITPLSPLKVAYPLQTTPDISEFLRNSEMYMLLSSSLNSVCANLSFPHAVSGNPLLILSRFWLKDCRNDMKYRYFRTDYNSLHFSGHSEWSPFASLRTGSAESRNLFQAKRNFSTHEVCLELVSGFGRNDTWK